MATRMTTPEIFNNTDGYLCPSSARSGWRNSLERSIVERWIFEVVVRRHGTKLEIPWSAIEWLLQTDGSEISSHTPCAEQCQTCVLEYKLFPMVFICSPTASIKHVVAIKRVFARTTSRQKVTRDRCNTTAGISEDICGTRCKSFFVAFLRH
jgi:hypothetical protein